MNELNLKAIKLSKNNKPYLKFSYQEYETFLLDLKDGEELLFTISKKRTLNQNRLFHQIIRIVAEYIGESFDTTKIFLVCKFFGCEEVEINGNIYTVPVSTSKLDKKSFSEGLTNLYIWANEENIKLPN